MDLFEQGDQEQSLIMEQAKADGYLHGYESGYREGLVLGYPEGYQIGRELGIMLHNIQQAGPNEELRRKSERLMVEIMAFPRDNSEGIDRPREMQRLRAAYRELASGWPALAPLENTTANKFDF